MTTTAIMRTSQKARMRLRQFEGDVLTAYPDPATKGDPWTIGVGHTGPDVKKGMVINAAQSDALLTEDLAKFEAGVRKLAPICTQGQFDALVSFSFNVGLGSLASSTLLRMHNEGKHAGAADQFLRWDKAAGKQMPGLTKRRRAEREMYLA